VRAFIAQHLRQLPWAFAVYTLEDLAQSEVPSDPYVGYLRNSFDERFCPDVVILQREGLMLGWRSGTTHGSPYAYDRRIPLYFLGKPFEPGPQAGLAGSHDVTPTLLSVLGIALGEFDGKDRSIQLARKP